VHAPPLFTPLPIPASLLSRFRNTDLNEENSKALMAALKGFQEPLLYYFSQFSEVVKAEVGCPNARPPYPLPPPPSKHAHHHPLLPRCVRDAPGKFVSSL
jgi:hypothetical protein